MDASPAGDDDASGPEDPVPARRRRHRPEILRFDFEKASYLIGMEAASSMGIPLIVGIATGYSRIGARGSVGSFFTVMAIFQPGHRSRARIVAGAGSLVALGAFLGSYVGIHSLAIVPLVGARTFGVGMAVALGPQAALIGVSSATSMVYAAGIRVSHAQAVEVGAVMLLSGLLTALVTLVTRNLREWSGRARSQQPPEATGLRWVRRARHVVGRSSVDRDFAFWHALRLAIAGSRERCCSG